VTIAAATGTRPAGTRYLHGTGPEVHRYLIARDAPGPLEADAARCSDCGHPPGCDCTHECSPAGPADLLGMTPVEPEGTGDAP
jgi:hypothetical protein